MIKLSMGYPDLNAQADILRDRGLTDPLAVSYTHLE